MYNQPVIEKELRHIADMLVLNGTLVDCPGLVHGKTGISIFFCHYAKYTGNDLFLDYALDLIKEIQTQIHINSPADYKTGLAGIGVGLDYLITQQLLNANDDILEEFDERMYRAVMYDPWQDFSLYDGLTGYGRYWMIRQNQQKPLMKTRKSLLRIINCIEEKLFDISVKEKYEVYCFLHDLHEKYGFDICSKIWEQCRKWNLPAPDVNQSFSRLGDSTVGNIIRMYHCSHYFGCTFHDETDEIIKFIPDLDMGSLSSDMGLLTGYAGKGMLRLMALNQMNMSWAKLL